jgi:XTP/dITP diphosphohydrolase
MRVYVCSSNRGKLRDFSIAAQQAELADVLIEPLPRLEGIAAPEENGSTFEENAVTKALHYARFTNELVLADDSGLCVDALNDAPGVHSARYAGPDATDEENNNLLLRDLGTTAHREARFVCVLALARREQILATQQGFVEGQILLAPRGDNGFGYDPLFFYSPLNRSFGELTPAEKFSVSHRGNAIRALWKRFPGLSGSIK